jgi:hypothetical protein
MTPIIMWVVFSNNVANHIAENIMSLLEASLVRHHNNYRSSRDNYRLYTAIFARELVIDLK